MIQDALIVFNMFLLEALLSVDNAAALAVIVKDLPEKSRIKALRYGIIGAFAFRIICLLLVGWLIKILWLKALGGFYLLYLSYKFFFNNRNEEDLGDIKRKDSSNLIRAIFLVEFVDIAFSIDNIFAAVAMSSNIKLVIIGVCLGIFAMRFIAQWFVALLHSYPSLETSAFIVITLLGLKLIWEASIDMGFVFPTLKNRPISHTFDFIFSGIMMVIFFFPILVRSLSNRRKKEE